MRPLRFQLTLLTLTVLTMFVSAALDWGPLVLLSFVSIPALLFVLVVTIFAVQPAQGAPEGEPGRASARPDAGGEQPLQASADPVVHGPLDPPGGGGAPRSEPRKDRPRLNHLDRFLLHSVWVFALLALGLSQALASGDLGNGVIVVFVLPVLLIGALCAALGVLVVPTKLLWRRAAESRALRRAAQR